MIKPITKGSLLLLLILIVLTFRASQTYHAPTINHYLLLSDSADAYSSLFKAALTSYKSQQALVKLAISNENVYWLKQAASLGNVDAMMALSKLDNSSKNHYWLKQAAKRDHAPSQFELSLVTIDREEALKLKASSAEQNYAPAIIALAKHYFDIGPTNLAKEYLVKASNYDPLSRLKLARLQYKLGEKQEAIEHFRWLSKTMKLANEYLYVIENTYQVKSLSHILKPLDQRALIPSHCSQNIQFVATNLESALQAHKFKETFERDKRLFDLPICIKPVIWLDESKIDCQIENNRSACDLGELAQTQVKPDFTHLVFFLRQGKAYVNKGVMYLDTADYYSVFVHELAHFVGFVDEYSVPAKLAAQYCYSEFPSAPNLLISNVDEEDIQNNEKYKMWLNLSKQNFAAFNDKEKETSTNITKENAVTLSLSSTNTCSNLNIKAYKPSNEMTFMEFHDVGYIPELYKILWQHKLQTYHQKIMIANHLIEYAETESARKFWSNLI